MAAATDPADHINNAIEEESRKPKSLSVHIWKTLEQLSQTEKLPEQIQNLRTAEQELKHKLKQLQEILWTKDEETQTQSMTLMEIKNEIEELFNTIEDLRQDQQALREQLSRRQEEQIFWWSCVKDALWKGVKIAGRITLCVLLPVGIMASMASVCNSPDCNLWNVAFNLLESYGELPHQFPAIY